MKTPLPSRLAHARKIEIAKLPPWNQVLRGTLLCYYLPCGKPNCRCHRAKAFRHGPYWYVTVTLRRGKTKTYFIPVHKLAQARRGILAYQKLWKGICRISEINLTLLKANQKEKS